MTSSDITTAKNALHNELTNEKVINRHRIRCLCRDHPGLIAASSLRLKLWIILLLGRDYSDNSIFSDDDSLIYDDIPCEEGHVLENDVTRTRAEIEEFRSTAYRKSITIILQEFCKKHRIQYKQGMNEVLAPFIYLCPPSNQPKKLPFILFESFIFRYLERYFCLDDSSYLYKAFRLFHILLLYHDPQLAIHLQENDFPPELYSPQWFLTLYSRSLPMAQVLRLWDMIISIDDPAFTFFVGLCLLRRMRSSMLLSEIDSLPEIIRDVSFSGEEDIDQIMIEAMQLYRITPRCFVRNLRLCCVSSSELSPNPSELLERSNVKNKSTPQQDSLDRDMSVQSVRKCLTLTPQELITILLPINDSHNSSNDDSSEPSLQQFVIIDIRSQNETESNGSGTIPRAISMDPDFVDHPDALEKWIQHFDGTRGCNICIVDMPPGKASSMSLWRRLLLGEGDGFGSVSYGSGWMKNNKETDIKTIRDFESAYIKDEEEAIEEESIRPAIKLALALQTANFPNVSVLEGGFPHLVQQLIALRGTVHPLIDNHNNEVWESFLKSTGRTKYSISESLSSKSKASESEADSSSHVRTVADLTQLEIFEIALETAVRLGHSYTVKVIKEKIRVLTEHVTGMDSTIVSEVKLTN